MVTCLTESCSFSPTCLFTHPAPSLLTSRNNNPFFKPLQSPVLGSGMRDSSLWLSINVRDRCCQHLQIRKAQS